jgi:hypothetical protein
LQGRPQANDLGALSLEEITTMLVIPIKQYNKLVLIAEFVRVGSPKWVDEYKALDAERKAKLNEHYKALLAAEDFRVADEGLAKLRRTQGELKVNYLRAVALLRETTNFVR